MQGKVCLIIPADSHSYSYNTNAQCVCQTKLQLVCFLKILLTPWMHAYVTETVLAVYKAPIKEVWVWKYLQCQRDIFKAVATSLSPPSPIHSACSYPSILFPPTPWYYEEIIIQTVAIYQVGHVKATWWWIIIIGFGCFQVIKYLATKNSYSHDN